MDRKTIENSIISIISHVIQLDPTHIKLEKVLYASDGLNMDDLDRIEMTMDLEDKFEFFIDDRITENWVTVKDVVDFVEHKLKNAL